MTSPTVVGSGGSWVGAVGREGTGEIGVGQGEDLVVDPERDHGLGEGLEGAAEFAHEVGVRPELAVVRIVPADAAEEDLASIIERAAPGDEAGDRLELVPERGGGVGEDGVQVHSPLSGGGEGGSDDRFPRPGATHDRAVPFFQQVLVGLAGDLVEGLEAMPGGGVAVRPVRIEGAGVLGAEPGQGDGSRGADAVLHNLGAHLQAVDPGDGDGKGNLVSGKTLLVQQVGHPPSPSGAERLVRHRALPLDLLIGVREQLDGHGNRAGEVLCARDGVGEGADVGHEGQLPGVE